MGILNQNFDMFAGDTKLLKVTVTDENNDPKDLTGADIKWALRKLGDNLIEKESPASITIIDPVNGVYIVSVEPIDTEGFDQGRYTHQSQIIDSGGANSVVLSGIVTMYDTLFN